MTEYGFNDVDLVDELVSSICPIDVEGPSKQGKYYCLVNGKRKNFKSFVEAQLYSKETGRTIWAYSV